MRESYRAKQSRKARINREKLNKKQTKKLSSKPKEEKTYDDVVCGRNAVLELLKSERDINKIYIQNGEKHGSITEIIGKARDRKIVTVEVSKQKLDLISQNANHQGVVAVIPPYNYASVDDILNQAKEKNEDPFILILDGIEDVHNLGAIIRTAETAGVHGIIIPKRRTATVNSTVAKVSAGATTYVKIARVNNLNDTIKYLKDNGLWIIGTDGNSKTLYYDQDYSGPIGIVIGSEGFGISDLVKKNLDYLVKIPMEGNITSLNASVSCGIVTYEALKQRLTKEK